MTAKLSFQTTQTPYGLLHDMRVTDAEKGTEKHYHLTLTRPEGVTWAGPVYLAENGSAFRIGRGAHGEMVAWKSVKISKRFGQESYRMRSVPGGYKGDYVKCWSRNINGQTFDFSRIYWNAGQDGSTLRCRRPATGEMIHEFTSPTPVTMK